MALHMRRLERWLLRKGFRETTVSSGHRHFKHPDSGHKITIKGHGRFDVNGWTLGQFLKSVRRAGFDPTEVRRELER